MIDTDTMDAEANAFAMEMLIPFDWIVRDSVGVDLCDEDGIARLAKRYRVPVTTMAVRIGEVRAEIAGYSPPPNHRKNDDRQREETAPEHRQPPRSAVRVSRS